MPIDPILLSDVVGQISSLPNLNSNGASPVNELGKDAFLRLLIAQLQNQDPLEPLKDHEFLGQMAQFSALEQMQNLNQSFEALAALNIASQASIFLGRQVVAVDSQSGETIAGIVTSVRVGGGEAILLVNDQEIPISAVQQISLAPPTDAPPTTS